MVTSIIPLYRDTHMSFSLPSSVEKISEALGLAKNFILMQGILLNEFDFEVVFREATTNAIQHGNQNDIEKVVTIEMELIGNLLIVLFQDEGEGFDIPETIVLPESTKSAKRGLYLMKELGFDPHLEGSGNQLLLSKEIQFKH